jgi:myo-inositol 2-dehydrogenase/D-chiro-inositol 1-dehydrogenase
MKEIRLGIVGCGAVAESCHWTNWDRLRGARVTAVTDLRIDIAKAAARRFGARAYSSHRTLIENAEVDALFFFLPPFAHGEPERLAVERGLPFFTEKPVALSLDTAVAIAKAVLQKSLITSVGYQWRYSASVKVAKTILSNRKIAAVHGYWLGSAAHRRSPKWWVDRALSGGQLIEQSTHIIDLMRYFGGEVRTVYCHQVNRLVEELGIPDTGAVVLHYVSGALGTLVNGCSLTKNSFHAGLNVVARGIYSEVTLNRVLTESDDGRHEYPSPNDPAQDPYLLEDQTFIDAVHTGDASKIQSPYSDAVKTLAITLAAEESSRIGKSIDLESVGEVQ